MRIDEIEFPVYREIAEKYNIKEEQLDEVIPAIAAIAGGVARAAAGGLARGAARAVGGLAKGAARTALGGLAGGAAQAALGGLARGATRSVNRTSTRRTTSPSRINNPNATVGSQDDTDTSTSTTTNRTAQQKTTSKKIGPGKMIKLPTQNALGKIGPPKNFRVKQVKGDEVEIINPMPKPGEPTRFVFNKNELGSIIDET